MKKIIAAMLMLLCIVSICSCSSGSNVGDTSVTDSTAMQGTNPNEWIAYITENESVERPKEFSECIKGTVERYYTLKDDVEISSVTQSKDIIAFVGDEKVKAVRGEIYGFYSVFELSLWGCIPYSLDDRPYMNDNIFVALNIIEGSSTTCGGYYDWDNFFSLSELTETQPVVRYAWRLVSFSDEEIVFLPLKITFSIKEEYKRQLFFRHNYYQL